MSGCVSRSRIGGKLRHAAHAVRLGGRPDAGMAGHRAAMRHGRAGKTMDVNVPEAWLLGRLSSNGGSMALRLFRAKKKIAGW